MDERSDRNVRFDEYLDRLPVAVGCPATITPGRRVASGWDATRRRRTDRTVQGPQRHAARQTHEGPERSGGPSWGRGSNGQ